MALNDVQEQAWTLWSLLCNRALTEKQVQVLKIMLSSENYPLHRSLPVPDSLSQLLKKQPQAQALKKRWQSCFMDHSLDGGKATAFINDLISILELVDELFVALPVVGQTEIKQGKIGDASVRRPAGKNSGWTLMLTIDGGGTFNCVRQFYDTSVGDMVLLAPGALYDYRRTDDQVLWHHYWIYCNLSSSLVNALNWEELGPYVYHLRLRSQDSAVVQGIFQQLFAADPSEKELSTALRTNLTEQIFLHSFQWAASSGGQTLNESVKRAMYFIEQHLHDSITVDDIASAAGLSRARLSALFKNSLERSMMTWRDERRMAQACQLLMSSTMKVHSVAKSLGYDDALYFSRQFRKIVGESPQAYRKKRF